MQAIHLFNEYMTETGRIGSLIHKEFPDFGIHTLSKIGEGEDSKAFLVNETYIFRFPKRDKIRRSLAIEIAVLPKIKKQLPLAVPGFEYISKEINFVGYRKIPGEALTKELFDSFPAGTQKDLQKTLAGFLLALHAININSLTDTGIETYEYREEYEEDFERIREAFYPQIPVREQEHITGRFRAYLDDPAHFIYTPALLHNDFSSDHILVDPVTQQLSGIIDFGDISIGDPDYDLKYLPQEFGKEFLSSFLQYYPHSDPRLLSEKIRFIHLGDLLQGTLTAHEDHNEGEVRRGMRSLHEWLKKDLNP